MIYKFHCPYCFLEHMERLRSQDLAFTKSMSPSPFPSPEVWVKSRTSGTISQALAPRITGTPQNTLAHFHHHPTQIPTCISRHRSISRENPWITALSTSLLLRILSSSHPCSLQPSPGLQPAHQDWNWLLVMQFVTGHCGDRKKEAEDITGRVRGRW